MISPSKRLASSTDSFVLPDAVGPTTETILIFSLKRSHPAKLSFNFAFFHYYCNRSAVRAVADIRVIAQRIDDVDKLLSGVFVACLNCAAAGDVVIEPIHFFGVDVVLAHCDMIRHFGNAVGDFRRVYILRRAADNYG